MNQQQIIVVILEKYGIGRFVFRDYLAKIADEILNSLKDEGSCGCDVDEDLLGYERETEVQIAKRMIEEWKGGKQEHLNFGWLTVFEKWLEEK